MIRKSTLKMMLLPALMLFGGSLFAADAPKVSQEMFTINNTWILVATFLVFVMHLGFATLEAGLTRAKNTVNILFKNTVIVAIGILTYALIGFSMMFPQGNWVIPNLLGFNGIGLNCPEGAAGLIGYADGNYSYWAFFMFQGMFAATAATIVSGAVAERIKLSSFMIFSAVYVAIVYPFLGSWCWGGGWLAELGVMDFAGGLVVHATAGISSLVIVRALGARHGFPNDSAPPHNPGMVAMGACMLWVGWFGFNGGSALAADGSAGMALTVTHIAAATASLVWMMIEWKKYGKPSLVGLVTGTIAGLATITPASGFVGPLGALIIGAAAGFVCFKMVQVVKQAWKLDDSLDVFAVHGVGGSLGTLLVAFLCAPEFGGLGLPEGKTMWDAFGVQAIGLAATIVMPEDAPAIKRAACLGYGARVELAGFTSDDRKARAETLEAEQGLAMIQPFDDPAIIAGQGTVGLELLEQAPEPITTVLVPIGGGGLVSGVLAALRPDLRVIGVEPEAANGM